MQIEGIQDLHKQFRWQTMYSNNIYKWRCTNFTNLFHKSMPQQNHQESQFTIAFQTFVSFSLMIHNHHSSSINILQTLLMVGSPKLNDVIFLHLINLFMNYDSWSIRDSFHWCQQFGIYTSIKWSGDGHLSQIIFLTSNKRGLGAHGWHHRPIGWLLCPFPLSL